MHTEILERQKRNHEKYFPQYVGARVAVEVIGMNSLDRRQKAVFSTVLFQIIFELSMLPIQKF